MNPISVAIKGKGPLNFLRRATSIARRYGATPGKMERALAQFVLILDRFGCSATFPITLVALQRHPRLIGKYHAQGIEFAVHGYRHLDHSQLSRADQLAHLTLARQVMVRSGIRAQGFRGPYLRRNPDTLAALQQQGFTYDNSQALAWDVLDGADTSAYRHVLGFYKALSASDYPSLPSLEENLVCMPYSLPDDEALVERLALKTPDQMSAPWLAILRRTYELGELFTLGLHPERIAICREPLAAVLGEACQLTPSVWIARLDEIAAWWRARAAVTCEMADTGDGQFRIAVKGPASLTILARAVQVEAPTRPWLGGYRRVDALSFTVQADRRPWIGMTARSSTKLFNFLWQQGYLVETAADACCHSICIDQTAFTARDERALLARLEETETPLVRLGRWPNGARSALSITGDIDALTLWDYGLRLVGR